MERKWNSPLVFGFLVTIAAFISTYTTFANFALTSDFSWLNLSMFAVGLSLLGAGLKRTFRQPDPVRGKIRGIVASTLGLIAFIGFLGLHFHVSAQLPASDGAPRVWTKAPDFTLSDQNGKPVTLYEILKSPSEGFAADRGTYVLLVFYRGYW